MEFTKPVSAQRSGVAHQRERHYQMQAALTGVISKTLASAIIKSLSISYRHMLHNVTRWYRLS